jgi:hypothetical protein
MENRMKSVSKLAALLFSLVAIGHLARLLWHVPITIGRYDVPLWFSIVGVVIPSALALALSRERQP